MEMILLDMFLCMVRSWIHLTRGVLVSPFTRGVDQILEESQRVEAEIQQMSSERLSGEADDVGQEVREWISEMLGQRVAVTKLDAVTELRDVLMHRDEALAHHRLRQLRHLFLVESIANMMSLNRALGRHVPIGRVVRGAPRPRVIRPPGRWARIAVEFLFSKKTVASVFEPLFADSTEEWIEATSERRFWKARWIRVRYNYYVVLHVLAQAPLSAMKIILEAWKLI